MFEWLNGWFTPTPKEVNLNKLTKLQLEAKGRKLGIELDRRLKKINLLNKYKK